MEQHILALNPELRAALIVSTPGHQPALLIEPATATPLTTTQQAQLIEKIWPSIQQANANLPAHTRVDKALILVTTPDRPLPPSSSSDTSLDHAANAQRYAAELETLYANADSGPVSSNASDRATIAQLVQECVSAVTSWPHDDGPHHQPGSGTFFERGMDSVVALQLVRVLRRGLWCPWVVGLSTVYCNPTVVRLAEAVFEAVQGEVRESSGTGADSE